MEYKIAKNIDPSIYRGYDIRGIVDEQINEDVYYTFGRAYATFLANRRVDTCTVGHDVRLSSEKLSKALVAGLNDGGINTIELGSILAQMSYFSVYEYKNKGALMVTASHNPKEYNGLKLSTGYSESMDGEDIQEFRALVESCNFVEPEKKGESRVEDIFPAYSADILKRFDLKKKWKVVVDGCTSGSGVFLPAILKAAGCEVIEQNCVPDGNFPLGTPDPIDEGVLNRIGEGVKKSGADIGLAYDPDGDRMAVADENGNILWMDVIVALFAKSVIAKQPNAKIVYNVLCSKAVTDTVVEAGGQPIMWMTGHAYIKQRLVQEKASFGGELSGHIFFYDNFYGYDDSANASLRLLDYMESTGKNLSQLVSELPQYISSPQIKIGMSEHIKFSFIKEKIVPEFKKTWPDGEFTEIDGIRMELPDRMVILRASQNGAYITTKFEGKTQEAYDDLRVKLYEILAKYPEVEWDSHESSNVHKIIEK
jgi:Phosphomannomutase